MLDRSKLWFLRTFFGVALFWWMNWSKVFRAIAHRKYKGVELETGLAFITVSNRLRNLKWTKDGTAELWDACGSPHWVQYALNEIDSTGTQPKGGLDCDDFSSWAASAADETYDPYLLQAAWLDQDGKPRGHVMCLLHLPNGKVVHIGNWGMSEARDFEEDLIGDVLQQANASELIGWSVMTPDLRLMRKSTKLPRWWKKIR